MKTKSSNEIAKKKTSGKIPKSENLPARTMKSTKHNSKKTELDNTENRGVNNTTPLDNSTEALQYTHSEVQQILYLSMVTGFMLCNFAHREQVENVNLDKLAENVFKYLTTRDDIKSLLSSPQISLGFAVECSEAIPKRMQQTEENTSEKEKKSI